MRRLFLRERGSALVSAMGVMSVMAMAGLATFATVDVQQEQSQKERTGESSFNLSEAALNTQAFVLSRDWPGTANGAYPNECSQKQGGRGCPEDKSIMSGFKNFDVDANATWQTNVRDDGGSNPNFYDDATVMSQPTWDANGNQRVWVRSESVVHGKKRTLVALVRVDLIEEQMPMNVLTAGFVATNNNGNKTIIDSGGRPMAVRCKSENNPKCLSFRDGQVQPPGAVQQGYPGTTALSSAAIDRLRTRAIALGEYYPNGCPPSMGGEVVFVEGPADCNYNGGGNSPSSPGVFIIMNGTLHMGGNGEYYGLVYMGNLQGSSDYVITMRGTSLIQGAIAIDGDGGIEAGASKENVIFDQAPFQNLRSFGSAGIVQNSWREIRGG